VPALEAAFAARGVQLVAAPIDYSENLRVLVDEQRLTADIIELARQYGRLRRSSGAHFQPVKDAHLRVGWSERLDLTLDCPDQAWAVEEPKRWWSG
jgi:hypothetical protein